MRSLLILALLYCQQAAAQSFVQAAAGDGTTTVAAGALNTTTGNLLYVFSRAGNSDCRGLSGAVTNTAGNTYILIAIFTSQWLSGGVCDGVWYAKNITGNVANVVSITWSTAQPFSTLSIQEWSGLDTSLPLDAVAVTQTNNVTNTVFTSGAFSTVQANEVIIAAAEWRATANTFTAGAGFTLPAAGTDGLGISASEYKIVSSIQSNVTAAMTATNNVVGGLVVVTFRKALVPVGAINFVQANININSGTYVTSATTAAAKTTTGNLLALFIKVDRFDVGAVAHACSGLISSVVDTASDSFTQVGTIVTADNVGSTAGACLYWYVAPNITGNAANVITVSSATALRRWSLSFSEWNNLRTTTPFNQTASATSTGATSLTTGAFTTTSPAEVILMGGTLITQNVLFTAGTSYQIPAGSTVQTDNPNGENSDATVQWKIVSTIQSGATASMSFDSSNVCGVLLISLGAQLQPNSGAGLRGRMITF